MINTAPSDSPVSVSGRVIDSNSVTLSWSQPPAGHRNGVIRKYILTAEEMETGNEYTWESVLTSITIHSLHPFYTYQFRVAAYTVQRGPFSYIVTLQTETDGKKKQCLGVHHTVMLYVHVL